MNIGSCVLRLTTGSCVFVNDALNLKLNTSSNCALGLWRGWVRLVAGELLVVSVMKVMEIGPVGVACKKNTSSN